MIHTLTLNPALDRELIVPTLAFDEVLRATASRTDIGGKGFNVSRALAALGAASVALGFIGGATGQQLAHGLEALGIRTDFVPIAGETRTNVSIVAADHSHYLKANESGPQVSSEEQTALLDRVRALAAPGDWWVLSGSLPPGVPADFYATIIRIVQARGARAVLDTNGDPLRSGCAAGVYLVKPNQAEAVGLTRLPLPSPRECGPLLAAIHRLGARLVALSMGAAGAAVSDGEHVWLAHAPTIDERNPAGAGDALIAGLVWALDRGYALPDALVWGVACGAATASLDGTAVGSGGLVVRLREQVRVEAL